MVPGHTAEMSRPTNLKTEQLEMESFFDFNQGTANPSPATATSSRNDALSPFDKTEERQHFSGPSHDYNQYRQQVGLPAGSMANMPMSQSQMFDGFNSGIGEIGMDGGFGGWSTGIDVDGDMGMDFANPNSSMPAMFFPPQTESAGDNFINPNTIGGQEESTSNVGRLWPGMHSQQAQQAAMRKAAQVQHVQQRQMKMQAQNAHYRQVANNSNTHQNNLPSQPQSQASSKRSSNATEPHVEESISRLLHQMRQNSSMNQNEGDSPGSMLPHIARMKKDEEEMDEDERLLNSDEGKKLSSKERRQLRNKVSARAFRSRRKEYISQLEGEIALKTQEANSLRQDNGALVQENDRYRGLIETLLRHPAFTPFINDISQDPSVLGMPQMRPQMQAPPPPPQQQQRQPPQPTPQPQQQPHQEVKPEFLNFDASQLQVPGQPQEQHHVNLAMIPEENFSKLNIGSLQPRMDFNNFSTVNAYAVTSVPCPDPVKLLSESPAHLPATSTSATSAYDLDATTMNVLLAKLNRAAGRLAAV